VAAAGGNRFYSFILKKVFLYRFSLTLC